MGETIGQPIHFPGERVYPGTSVSSPEADAVFESESTEIEEAVHEAATYAQDPDIILGSPGQHVLSDRAQQILTSLNEAAKKRDIQRQISDGNRRNLSTNRTAMVRQFGSLTLFKSRIKKSKGLSG